jgi:carbon-monoxide dehydrogenase medium subunit
MNQMRSRAVAPRHVINISRVAGLDQVGVAENGALRIGALAKLATVANSALVSQGWPLLRETILEIGLVQLRNMATLAGNICRPAPSADSAVAMLVLEASVVMSGTKGSRKIPVSEFLAGARQAMLADSELVTEVRVPPLPAGAGTAFLKLAVAKVNVAVLLVSQNGSCSEARVGLGGVAATLIRAPKAEAVLRGRSLNDELIDEAAATAAGETSPGTDLRCTADYRREMSRVLVRRAVRIAWDRAQGEKEVRP